MGERVDEWNAQESFLRLLFSSAMTLVICGSTFVIVALTYASQHTNESITASPTAAPLASNATAAPTSSPTAVASTSVPEDSDALLESVVIWLGGAMLFIGALLWRYQRFYRTRWMSTARTGVTDGFIGTDLSKLSRHTPQGVQRVLCKATHKWCNGIQCPVWALEIICDEPLPGVHHAAASGWVTGVQEYLDDQDTDSVDLRDRNGATPLMHAAEHGHDDVGLLLLELGADVNAEDAEMSTPLLYAAHAGHSVVVARFLEWGADVNHHLRDPLGIGPQPNRDCTALILAARGGYAHIVELLLGQSADPMAVSYEGVGALLAAAECGHVDALRSLLQSSDTCWGLGGADGHSPLTAAVVNRSTCMSSEWLELCQMLITAKAEANTPKADGKTPLMLAAESSDLELVHVLLRAKADATLQDSNGMTALMLAAQASGSSAQPVVRVLALAGGVAATDNRGLTAFSLAMIVFDPLSSHTDTSKTQDRSTSEWACRSMWQSMAVLRTLKEHSEGQLPLSRFAIEAFTAWQASSYKEATLNIPRLLRDIFHQTLACDTNVFQMVLTLAVDILVLPLLLLLLLLDILFLFPLRYASMTTAGRAVAVQNVDAAAAGRMHSEIEVIDQLAQHMLQEAVKGPDGLWTDDIFSPTKRSIYATGDEVEEIDLINYELFGRLCDAHM